MKEKNGFSYNRYAGRLHRKKSKNNYCSNDLTDKINERIAVFQEQEKTIVYVKNVGRRKKEPYISDFVQGLSIVSDNIVLKEKASLLSNTDLLKFLTQNNISQLEIAGIDGNCCVARSAIHASNFSFSVILPLKYISIKDKERFANTRKIYVESQIQLVIIFGSKINGHKKISGIIFCLNHS